MPATKSKQDKARELLSFLPRQDRHKPKGEVKKSKVSRWRAAVLIAVHVAIGIHIWHWLATGESMTPVEPSEAMQTVELGKINAGFVLFLGLIGSTLIFGRWFCGWACHVVAVQDLCAWVLKKMGLKPRPVRSRLLVFGPWVVGFYMFVWPMIYRWWVDNPLPKIGDWQWEVTTTELWKTFPGPLMTILTFLVAGVLIVWWLGAKGFCTFGCPYGAFFAMADRVAPMRIKVSDACEHCGHCTTSCTSNVRVHEEVAKYGQVVDPGCMKCMDCVSVCPTDALSFGFAKPTPFIVSQQRIKARADFTWGEEVLLAVVAFFAAEYVFRGAWFGDGIPLLLAVGLGVITAVLTLAFVRLLRQRDMTFQHWQWKHNGKFTRVGRFVLVGLVGWLLFSGHTAIANSYRRAADDAVGSADKALYASVNRSRPVAAEELEPAIAAIEAARPWLFGERIEWLEWRGLALRSVGRHREAYDALIEAQGDRPGMRLVEASFALAEYHMDPANKRYAEARQLVNHGLGVRPTHPFGLYLLRGLKSIGK